MKNYDERIKKCEHKGKVIWYIPDEIMREAIGAEQGMHSFGIDIDPDDGDNFVIQKCNEHGDKRDCTIIYARGRIKVITGKMFKPRR